MPTMADYRMKVFGHLVSGELYSWSWNISTTVSMSAIVTAMAAALNDFWTNGTYGLGVGYVAGITLDSFDVALLDSTFHEVEKLSHTLGLVGTSTDPALPDDSTVVMRKVTAGVRRNERGFTHFPAPSENNLVSGKYTDTSRDRFTAASRALLAAVTALPGSAFVHTGATESKRGVPPYTKTNFIDVTCSNKPGSQRGRTRKVKGVYS